MLGVVVVTHNSDAVLGACLESCRKFVNAPVVVVDNASTDNSVTVARDAGVLVCANTENRGFAAAVNQGVNQLGTELILLLNPDAELVSSVEPLVLACLDPQVGASAGALVDEETHQPQKGFSVRRFPNATTLVFETLGINRLVAWNPVNRQYRCADLNLSDTASIEQPAAAFFLFRRDAWADVGGFDESFHPIWFEDVDFCKRLINREWVIRYIPQAIAAHRGGHSAMKLESYQKRSYWFGSLLRYARKHCSSSGFRMVCAAVLLRSLLDRRKPSREPHIRSKVVSPARLALKGLKTGKM
jgi:N-acetylglucosaminyl-diphospho-decaprenol L-rhamnosyltransferase